MSDGFDGAVARATAWLTAWDLQGPHRTGSAGDHASADWLASEAAAPGCRPEIETFPLDRLDPLDVFLEIEGMRFEGIPVFDSPSTDGVAGALGPVGSAAPIAVAALSPRAVYTDSYRSMRRGASHRALVILCQGAHPGFGLLNAEQFAAPYGAPAIHLDSEAAPFVQSAVAHGATARLVARSRRTLTEARNVVVTLPGRDRTRRPTVVMTPRSSWWESTAERGGGLVCWLETLRMLLAAPPAGDVVMTANSGHELGHLGLDAFVAARPGWDRAGGASWVHYGANLGAIGGALSIMSGSDDLRLAMAAGLAAAGQPADGMAPPDHAPSGETRDIHRAGGRYVTLVGTNPWFHLPTDRWPHAVDAACVARIAAGAAAMVRRLTA